MWSFLICLDHLNLTHVGHGAANVTLGIPRLREIIMTASTKPKTPSMTMDVRAGTATPDIDVFCKKAGRLTMSQVVDKVLVRERLVSNGGSRLKEYLVDLAFYPKADYQQEYDVEPSEILAAFATRFPLILRKEIQNELKRRLPPSFAAQFPAGAEVAYAAIPLIPTLDEPLQTEVRVAFAQAMAVVWKVLAGVAAAGTVTLVLLKEVPMHTVTDERFGLQEKRGSSTSAMVEKGDEGDEV